MISSYCKICNKPFKRKNPNAQFCSLACCFSKSPEERFWDKVIKSDVPGECWKWTGSKNNCGYGTFGVNYKTITAHRFSYALHNGQIPDGMLICHKCDNPSCVNPSHLWLGTNADNTKDRESKGRGNYTNPAKGEKHWNVKLSESDVQKIRELIFLGNTNRHIAKMYNMSEAQISKIITGKTWKSLKIV